MKITLKQRIKIPQIRRIMTEGMERFNHGNCANQYIRLYERMLGRPVVEPSKRSVIEFSRKRMRA